MLPQKLKIKNFLPYGEQEESLDFRNFQIASLTGPNGAGKSSLLEAITWVLWGEARAKDEADLIHSGAKEMEVELEFSVNDENYRVFRKKGIKKTVLHLEHLEKGEFYDITEDSSKATQNKLVGDILKMPYTVFINSAFLRQGKADEFTVKSPVERKKILGEILGLDYYNQLVEKIRARLRQNKIETESFKTILKEKERDLAAEENLKKQAVELKTKVEKLKSDKERITQDLEKFQQKQSRLLADSEALKEKQLRLEQMKEEIEQNQKRLIKIQENLGKYQAIIKDKEEIETNYHKWEQAEKENQSFTEKLERQRQLENKRSEIEERINSEKHKLEMGQAKLESQITEIEKAQGEKSELEAEQEKTKLELAKLAKQKEEKIKLEKQIYQFEKQITAFETGNNHLRQNWKENKEKLTLISSAEAKCPLCQQKLTTQHREEISGKIERELSEQENQGIINKQKIEEKEAEIAKLKIKVNELERLLLAEEVIEQKLGELDSRLRQITEKENTLKDLKQQLQTVLNQVSQKTFSPLDQEILNKTEEEIQTLHYDPEQHKIIQTELAKLKLFGERKHHLDNARENFERETEELNNLKAKINKQQKEETDLIAAHQKTTSNLKDLSQINNLVDDLKQENLKFEGLFQAEQQNFSRVEAKLAQCNEARQYIDKYLKTVRQIETNSKDLILLEHAFGKDGIQAMIIENAIPEIENEANLILDRMTGGEMHVELETQKEKKTGGVKESLEIRITDKLGPRLYELFSGGESFRINFAIRIALSKLLSKRANAKLQFLVIDEGFGTQDKSGRENLITAINSIRSDFDKILVISHLQEVKEEFPTHIEVNKDESGSHIELKE